MNSAKDYRFPLPVVSAGEYAYDLPPERIAVYPLPERDRSKLLVANTLNRTIQHDTFRSISSFLPPGALLVMNNTRVITARLLMHKPTGGSAEVLCLSPIAPGPDPAIALQSGSPCQWRCMIGGRRIRPGTKLALVAQEQGTPVQLSAEVLQRKGTEATVEFSWEPACLSFAAVLDSAGVLPLPPYLKREAETDDAKRYQTVYAHLPGSVAAPTAGLHFTDAVLGDLRDKGIRIDHVTLHVGAGTFQPLQSDDVAEHQMHNEYISVPRNVVESLLSQAQRREHSSSAVYPVIPVGTTSVRTLESLYWFGVRLVANDNKAGSAAELSIEQWDPYRLRHTVPPVAPDTALRAVLAWMNQHDMDTATGSTGILIAPGYTFALCDALITNFHQPNSTLILLVAALLGKDLWRAVYTEALEHGYRFLSYGDSSLLLNFRREAEQEGGQSPMPIV